LLLRMSIWDKLPVESAESPRNVEILLCARLKRLSFGNSGRPSRWLSLLLARFNVRSSGSGGRLLTSVMMLAERFNSVRAISPWSPLQETIEFPCRHTDRMLVRLARFSKTDAIETIPSPIQEICDVWAAQSCSFTISSQYIPFICVHACALCCQALLDVLHLIEFLPSSSTQIMSQRDGINDFQGSIYEAVVHGFLDFNMSLFRHNTRARTDYGYKCSEATCIHNG
jgi:hypothetical protein